MCCIVRYVRSASMLSGTKTNHKSISSHPTSKITPQQNISLAASRPPVGSEMFRTPRGSVSSLLLNIFPRAFEFQLLQSRGLRSLIAFTYAEFGIFSGTLTFAKSSHARLCVFHLLPLAVGHIPQNTTPHAIPGLGVVLDNCWEEHFVSS